jgi:hypothetical protein
MFLIEFKETERIERKEGLPEINQEDNIYPV